MSNFWSVLLILGVIVATALQDEQVLRDGYEYGGPRHHQVSQRMFH